MGWWIGVVMLVNPVISVETRQTCLIAHCRNQYYREFAYKPLENESELQVIRIRKAPLKSDRDLLMMLDAYRNRPGYFVSVYAFSRVDGNGILAESAKINRIYLDYDYEPNPDIARIEVILTIRALIKHKIRVHVYFSGKKGFAVYIEFRTVDIQDDCKKEVIGRAFDIVKDCVESEYENFFGLIIPSTHSGFMYTLTTLDRQVRGDINRVSRIPNTKHKSGKYCIPLTYGDLHRPISEIIKIAEKPKDTDLTSMIDKCIFFNDVVPVMFKNIERAVLFERVALKPNADTLKITRRRFDAQNKEIVTDIRHFCFSNGISIKQIIPGWKRTSAKGTVRGTLYILKSCPFYPDHKDASIIQLNSGATVFHCFHNHCEKKSWKDLKNKFRRG